jgi:hypothetical protein
MSFHVWTALLALTGKKIKQMASGYDFHLFLMTDGTVYSCGKNQYGNLGRAASNGSSTKVNLGQIPPSAFPAPVEAIAAGYYTSVFRLSTGAIYTCGNNTNGALGRAGNSGSATNPNLAAIPASSFPAAVAEISCRQNFTLFRLVTGVVLSCGDNTNGQLGRVVATGSTTSVNLGQIGTSVLPASVAGVATGKSHSLFRLADGRAYSCGYNGMGELGRAVASGSATAANLGQISTSVLPSSVVEMAAGEFFSIFRLSSGEVYTCGYNQYGQLGRVVSDGSVSAVNLGNISASFLPTSVIKIRCFFSGVLFLLSTGSVYSCGNNTYGQLGRAVGTGTAGSPNLGEIPTSYFPAAVKDISANYESAMFVLSNGGLWSCGNSASGQLGRLGGDGSPTSVNLAEIPPELLEAAA